MKTSFKPRRARRVRWIAWFHVEEGRDASKGGISPNSPGVIEQTKDRERVWETVRGVLKRNNRKESMSNMVALKDGQERTEDKTNSFLLITNLEGEKNPY